MSSKLILLLLGALLFACVAAEFTWDPPTTTPEPIAQHGNPDDYPKDLNGGDNSGGASDDDYKDPVTQEPAVLEEETTEDDTAEVYTDAPEPTEAPAVDTEAPEETTEAPEEEVTEAQEEPTEAPDGPAVDTEAPEETTPEETTDAEEPTTEAAAEEETTPEETTAAEETTPEETEETTPEAPAEELTTPDEVTDAPHDDGLSTSVPETTTEDDDYPDKQASTEGDSGVETTTEEDGRAPDPAPTATEAETTEEPEEITTEDPNAIRSGGGGSGQGVTDIYGNPITGESTTAEPIIPGGPVNAAESTTEEPQGPVHVGESTTAEPIIPGGPVNVGESSTTEDPIGVPMKGSAGGKFSNNDPNVIGKGPNGQPTPVKDLTNEYKVYDGADEWSKIVANNKGYFVLHPVQRNQDGSLIFDPFTIGQILGYIYELEEFGQTPPVGGYTIELMAKDGVAPLAWPNKVFPPARGKRSMKARRGTMIFTKKAKVVAQEEHDYWKELIGGGMKV